MNIEPFLKKKKLTDAGIDFLKCSFDPFHDFQHLPAGYPDVDDSRSVVLCHTEAATISAPSTVAWDALFYNGTVQMTNDDGTDDLATIVADHVITPHNLSQDIDNADQDPVMRYSTFNCNSANAGEPLHVIDAAWASAAFASHSTHAKTDALLDMNSRIIGMGFEVHDISAEINKQGSVTVGCIPTNAQLKSRRYWSAAHYGSNALNADYSLNTFDIMAPPATVQQAVQYPNSATWEAKRGVYAVPKLSSIDNPVLGLESCIPTLLEQPLHHLTGDGNVHCMSSVPGTHVIIADTKWGLHAKPIQRTNFNTTFAFFNGIHADGQLRFVKRTYVEYFPRHDQTLLAVASPSPAYDDKALRLYSEIAPLLPVAVPVDENASGDWFRRVVKVMKKASQFILPVAETFVPGVKPVAQEVRAVQQTVRAVKKNKNKNKKPVNPQMGRPPR